MSKLIPSSTDEEKHKATLRKLILELKGSVKMPEAFISYEEVLQEALLEKYLKA
ncbi:MAG: hypothetical protein AAF798_20415 [Bacteroidota bacterium]